MDGEAHPDKVAFRDRREQVIAQLTDAFARDTLGLAAFETRIDAAYRCQTDAELSALVADLDVHDTSAVAIVVAKAELVRDDRLVAPHAGALSVVAPQPVVRALFSNIQRSDRSAMAASQRVEAIFGNVELDLRETRFVTGVTELRVKAVFGSIEIVVPADVAVEVHGAAVFGNFEGTTRTTADPDAPTLRVVGSATFASVVVKTVPPLRVQKLATELRARRLLPP